MNETKMCHLTVIHTSKNSVLQEVGISGTRGTQLFINLVFQELGLSGT